MSYPEDFLTAAQLRRYTLLVKFFDHIDRKVNAREEFQTVEKISVQTKLQRSRSTLAEMPNQRYSDQEFEVRFMTEFNILIKVTKTLNFEGKLDDIGNLMEKAAI